MPLAPGQTLSHYEIVRELGKGGMGEVWRARDTRLDREVAIKVLPANVDADPERLHRLDREARTLAALNHPHVAAIHGIDQVGETRFLAMELVPGEDLAQRLERGPLPVAEVIEVGRQIAEGLEAAHEAGIVHRDLKPANVRITPDGVVKVLDFGLAKLVRPGDSPTVGAPHADDGTLLTMEGVVLGTPAYMSPEQARGKTVDRRTDIWAWGCVVYECLTGLRAFDGETFSDVMAAILEQGVDLDRLPAATPPHLRHLLSRALTKDARLRLRDIGEARVALGGHAAVAQPDRARRPLPALIAGMAIASLAWLGATRWFVHPAETTAGHAESPLRTTIEAPAIDIHPKISADGRWILFGSRGGLWLRNLAEAGPQPIPNADNSTAYTWSADSQAIAFARGGSLMVLRLGEPRAERRCSLPERVTTLTWADNGAFLYEVGGRSEGIFHLPPGAVAATRLDWIDPDELHAAPHRFSPSFLPGGEQFLITDASGDEPWIELASLATRSRQRLVRAGSRAEYVAPGWLAWVDAGVLLVQAFDPATGTVAGTAREVAHGVDSFASTGAARFSFSSQGTVVYLAMEAPAEIEWIDRQGRVLERVAEPRAFSRVRLDPTGRWLAAAVITPETGYRDLWLLDLSRSTPQRLTQRFGWEDYPVWSPDGKRIAFSADWQGPPSIHLYDLARAKVEELVPFNNRVQSAGSFTADGKSLVYTVDATGSGSDESDLWIVDVDSRERRVLLETPHAEADPQVSPDGRWIAFSSLQSDRSEVHVATFPALTGIRRVSAYGGSGARWSGDSKELYYLTAARAIASVSIRDQDGLPDPREETIVIQASADVARFDVTRDGERFLVVRRTKAEMQPKAHLVVHWEKLITADGR